MSVQALPWCPAHPLRPGARVDSTGSPGWTWQRGEGRGEQHLEHQLSCQHRLPPCKTLWLQAHTSLAGEEGATCAGLTQSRPMQGDQKHALGSSSTANSLFPRLCLYSLITKVNNSCSRLAEGPQVGTWSGYLKGKEAPLLRGRYCPALKRGGISAMSCRISSRHRQRTACHRIRSWFIDDTKRAPINLTCFAKSFIFSSCEWCQIGSIINRRLLFILQSRYRSAKSVLRPQ